ncbi:uncharacterized protein [Coffea arabica]|uniref:MULE transposase domain-containing protein n=1 Tax=Coffea arabica TaxID=13443 RepID=A0ABM4V3I2_COFAR
MNKQQQQHEEAQGEESTVQHQHGGDQPIGLDSEEWNEPVTADEDFLYSSDENGPDYSYFNASVEFNKPNFELKREHHCGREYTNKHATSTYLSRKFQEKVRDDPNCSLDGIINDARRRFMVNISSKKAYRTKRKAREAIKGCDMEQYERLWDYAATVRQSNPDSHIAIQIDRRSIEERATFQRLFDGLGALKKGFLAGCRPIIGLDGCFLKGPFGGQLLAALGMDENDNMFPIGIAIELITYIGRGNVVPYTFISDRQKGLVHAIEELFPGIEHRFCLKHLFENFKAKFKDSELRELFWATASATNGDDFKRALNALEIAQPQNGENLTAAGWLKRLPYYLWSRAHYGMAAKTDISVNNLNESFNNYILKARDEPIVTFLEFFRRKLMQRLTLKRQGMEKYGGKLCLNIVEKLAKSVENSRHCIAIFDSIESFEVDGFNRTSVVNLQRRSCSCGAF